MPDPQLQGIFHRPFAEQLAAFRLRLGDLVPTQRWDDLRHSAHDRAFMVAGATKADLLADLAQAVDKAISTGTTLEEFRRDFRQIVDDHGWHGWTGEGTKGGEAWRTRVIYRTNMKTSYAAGRWAQLMEGGFKYGVYRHGGSLEPREEHLALDGLILPLSHPFWQIYAPPNGWGCSCYVLGARSIKGAIRLGGDPSVKLPPDWDKIDPRTGAPAGIDKGWAYAPGASVSDTVISLRDKLEKLPERPSIDLIQSWLNSGSFADWFANPAGIWPLVRIPAGDAKSIGSQRRVADLTPATAAKQLREHPDLTPHDYALAQNAVSLAQHRFIERDPRTGTLSRIYAWEEPLDSGGGYVIVVKTTLTGQGLFVTSFRRLSGDQAKRDAELVRLLNKAMKRKP